MTRAKFGLLIGLLGCVGVGAAILLVARSGADREPLPNPNGYDDFIRAQSALRDLPDKPEELPQDALQELVSRHAGALQHLRAGLLHGCRVPPDALGPWNAAQGDVLIGFKDLGRLLAAEAKLELIEGRTNVAVRIYGELIRFGTEFCRGGPIIHRQVGVTIESLGAARLRLLVPHLDGAACRDLVEALEAADRRRESPAQVLANEAEWTRRNTSVLSRLMFKLLPSAINASRRTRERVLAGIARQEAIVHQLQAELAARCNPLE